MINKEKTGQIIKEIIEQNPNSKDEIEKIINLINGDTELEETLHNIKLSYQRDAVGLSAEIFGGQNMRNVILQHMPIYEFETIDSIIDVIDEDEEDAGWQYVQESHLIENDLEQFDGYKYIRKYGHKQKILQKHDKFLVVTTTDKDTLESNIGVDLIYANINSGSFVFVQYKKMDQYNGKYIFYPNTQFHEERKRMSKFNHDLNKIKSENNYDNFRLSSSPLFFKFCKNLQLNTMNPQTIQGIYIPLDMWMKYEKTGPKTKAGKTVVQEGMPDKALTTSMFVDMVSRGLIGTKREAFAALSTYIEKCLDNKKSLVLSLEIDKS